MDVLSCIFFHMDPGDADPLHPPSLFDVDKPVFAQRMLKLGDLVSLGKVRIEIVLAGKLVPAIDAAVQGKTEHYPQFNHFPVQHGKDPGHSHADRTGKGVCGHA